MRRFVEVCQDSIQPGCFGNHSPLADILDVGGFVEVNYHRGSAWIDIPLARW